MIRKEVSGYNNYDIITLVESLITEYSLAVCLRMLISILLFAFWIDLICAWRISMASLKPEFVMCCFLLQRLMYFYHDQNGIGKCQYLSDHIFIKQIDYYCLSCSRILNTPFTLYLVFFGEAR